MTTDPAPDDLLLARAQRGQRDALDQLLRLHQPTIHAVCRRITGNDADALDATQEALIAVVRGLARFDGRARLSTWIYRIATNAALDELRRRQRRPRLGLMDDQGDAEPTDSAMQLDLAESVVARAEIDDALGQLAPEFRVAVVLRDLCRLDYAEIAEILEIPAGTVRSRIARGRGQLADLLRGNQMGPPERPTSSP